MSKYQVYFEYKGTDVEWLGDIPSEWKLCRLKFMAKIKNGQDYKKVEVDDGYPVMGSGGQFTYASEFMYDKESVLLGRKGTIDKPLYIDEPFWSVDTMYYTEVNKDISAKYLYYLALTIQFSRYSTNTALPSMTQENLSNFIFTVPNSLGDREKIANFLDHETAKIDTLIEKQQQLIKLLKEKRQAVISHAVTKGLNPNAPMRDSGVEWLGEVPAHWEDVPLKHLCSLLKDGTHLPPPRVDSGVPLLSVRNIIDSTFVFRSDDSNISEKDYEDLCRSFIPQQGDVLLAIVGGTIGKVAIIGEMTEFHIQRSVAIFRVKTNVLTSEGLANIIGSSNFQSLLWQNVGFSAQPGIYLGTLANFQFPIPPLNEQNQINRYCSSKSKRIDILISKAMSAVKLMQERRTALISAAVTGKIDVRNWKAA